jgi:hypothetical protein
MGQEACNNGDVEYALDNKPVLVWRDREQGKLFIGSMDAASNKAALISANITHIVQVRHFLSGRVRADTSGSVRLATRR